MLFNKPTEFNGKQFIDELKAAGVDYQGQIWVKNENELDLNVTLKEKSIVEKVLNAHVAIDFNIERNKARQLVLEKLGITAEEAALLLS